VSDTHKRHNARSRVTHVVLRVFPLITVLAASEEQAAVMIDAMEVALIAVNPSVRKGDLFEEVWIATDDENGEREHEWTRPPQAKAVITEPEDQSAGAEDRYLYGTVEPAAKVAERLHAALEHLRACELGGVPGADDQVVLDALFSYAAFSRATT
jgi:hypothetical protein